MGGMVIMMIELYFCHACGAIGSIIDMRKHIENADFEVPVMSNLTKFDKGDPLNSQFHVVNGKCMKLSQKVDNE